MISTQLIKQTKIIACGLLAFFLFTACGKFDRIDNGGFSTVTFNHVNPGGLQTKSVLQGGIMVYIYSDTFSTTLKMNDELQPASIKLPNGNYAFFAIGYDGPTPLLSGPTRCSSIGVGSRVVLNGSATTVSLNLTAAGCNDGIFVDSQASFLEGNMFNAIEVIHCGTAAGTALPIFASTDTCTGTPWATAQRYRFIAPIFRRDFGGYQHMSDGIVGPCQVASSAGVASAPGTYDRYPVGTMQTGFLDVFALEVETYSSTDCSTGLLARHRFTRGMIFGEENSLLGKAVATTVATFKTRLFLREP